MNILFYFCVCENKFQVSSRNGKAAKGNVKVITMLYISLQKFLYVVVEINMFHLFLLIISFHLFSAELSSHGYKKHFLLLESRVTHML